MGLIRPRLARISLWTLASAPVAVYAAFLSRWARDIPVSDDYNSVLPFLNEWLARRDVMGKLRLLHSQYFSHRIAATRLVALIDYEVFGRVNFIHLQCVGWLAWCAVFALLLWALPREYRTPSAAGVAALLLMHPLGYTNFLVGMQAVQNLGVVAVALVACHTAASRRCSMQIACLALVAAAPGVSANGLFTGIAAGAVAFAGGHRRWAAILAGESTAVAGVYFYGFAVEHQTFTPSHFLEIFFAAAGSPFALLRLGQAFAIPVGAVLLGALGYCALNRANWRRLPILCGFSVFLGSTIAMLAYGRMNWGTLYVLDQDRYKLYGLLIAATLFLFGCSSPTIRAAVPRFRIAAAVGSAIFCVFAYYNSFNLCLNEAAWAEATALNRQLGTWFIYEIKDGWPMAIEHLARSERTGVYRLPLLLSPRQLAQLGNEPTGPAGVENSLRVEARPDPPLTGQDLIARRSAGGEALPKFAITRRGGTPVFLPGMHDRVPLPSLLRKHAFIDNQYVSYFLPDALGLPIPETLGRWPPIEPGAAPED